MNAIHELHKSHLDGNNGRAFWQKVDTLPDAMLVKLGDLALRARVLLGADFQQMASIIHEYKQYGTWTDKQRRWVAMQIVGNWGALEWMTE